MTEEEIAEVFKRVNESNPVERIKQTDNHF
jgi:hypothetical protein